MDIFKTGKELLLNIQTPNISNDYFVTDSNGFFEMKRKFNGKWEGSVYPITSFYYLKDDKNKFGFFSKTPLGAISPNQGETLIYL